jgi:hypothetical protein
MLEYRGVLEYIKKPVKRLRFFGGEQDITRLLAILASSKQGG